MAAMTLTEILGAKGNVPEEFNAKLVLSVPDGKGADAADRTAKNSAVFNAIIKLSGSDTEEFPQEVSSREISWATLRMMKSIATQLESLVKAMPSEKNPLHVCMPEECVQRCVDTVWEGYLTRLDAQTSGTATSKGAGGSSAPFALATDTEEILVHVNGIMKTQDEHKTILAEHKTILEQILARLPANTKHG